MPLTLFAIVEGRYMGLVFGGFNLVSNPSILFATTRDRSLGFVYGGFELKCI